MTKRRLIYQVAVGEPCELYPPCLESVRQYCSIHRIDHFVQTKPKLCIKPDPATSGRSREAVERLGYLPIFEKENALELLGEYDQVAVVDADVYVRPEAGNIFEEFEEGYDFGGVVERDMPITENHRVKIAAYTEGQFRDLTDVDWKWDQRGAQFINMGVMVMNASLAEHLNGQTAQEFLARPEFKRFVDGRGEWKWSTDQTLLNWWLRSCGARIKHLHWKWNTMYKAVHDHAVADASFVHFFLSVYLESKNPQELLRRAGCAGV